MKRQKAIAWVLSAGAALLHSPITHAGSFCQILTHGPNFDGKVVHFRSHYSTAPEDFPGVFYDSHCRGSIEDITPDSAADTTVDDFSRAALADGLPHSFAVDISGKFRWNRRWKPESALLSVVKQQ